jgi:microcompartment protein CcmK/EutM
VLVVQEGKSASMASGRQDSPLDAAVVAVVDAVELVR